MSNTRPPDCSTSADGMFDNKLALAVPNNTVHRERDDEAYTKHYLLAAVDPVDSL
jgi:hypothetical protein